MSKLSKEVCKRCINECAIQKTESWKQGLKYWCWCKEDDEELWKKGKVICPEENWGTISINEIPDSCTSYNLEHTVLSEKPK